MKPTYQELEEENRKLNGLIVKSYERLQDMLRMDDGQAFKEADKFSKILSTHIERQNMFDVV